VLLQAGQGGGLASMGGGGGTDTVLGGRQAVTILTKLTWWCGGIFLLLSLALSLVPRGGNSSALQERLRAATPAEPQQAPLPLGAPTQTPGQAPAALPGAPTQKAPAPAAQTPAPAAPTPAPGTQAPAPQPKK
jgi:preprotein translocase subunit SecG